MREARVQRSGTSEEAADAGEVEGVEELLRTLASAVRSYRLYAGNGPMLERFVEALRDRVVGLWRDVDRLRLDIGENSMSWEGRRVFPTGDAGGELAFLFYKDGIRSITLLPGLEDELPAVLSVLGRAPQMREEEDDLVTLLWQENLSGLAYESVDPPVEVGSIGEPSGAAPDHVDSGSVREAAAQPDTPALGTDDFQETLYFLDQAELRQLEHEVRLEMARDLWTDVLNALLDRLEDGSVDRQIRVVALLEEVLPSMLAAGAFDRAAELLEELSRLATRPEPLPPPVLQRLRGVFGQLADEETLQQLVQMMDEPTHAVQAAPLERLLGFFPPQSLAPLTRLVDGVARPDARRLLATAAERLAAANRQEVVRLLGHPDPTVVRGALHWVGGLAIGAAASDVIRLLRHDSALVRSAAADAVVGLRAALAAPTLVELLDDPDREVRIASARALGALEHAKARPALEAAIRDKRLKTADRSEKLAFFEALGRVGGAEAVPFLGRLLNSRGWLGRGESPEVRACAAVALSRVRHPSARGVLEAAAEDADPVVRTAVGRALRGGDTA